MKHKTNNNNNNKKTSSDPEIHSCVYVEKSESRNPSAENGNRVTDMDRTTPTPPHHHVQQLFGRNCEGKSVIMAV